MSSVTNYYISLQAISLLGGGDVAQQMATQEAAPALLELSRGLGGSSPHCLQRVLCRLTSHANQLSLLPRVALHMFRCVVLLVGDCLCFCIFFMVQL